VTPRNASSTSDSPDATIAAASAGAAAYPALPATLDLKAWVGRQERREDHLHPTPVLALAATLDHDRVEAHEGAPLPPLWHWLYFLPLHQARDIGPDGHARRGGFLPPVPLPRRMWAGSRFEFLSPLHVSDHVQRVSTIESVQERQGLYVSAPEEIAFRRGFLTAAELSARGAALGKTAYGRYLIDVADGLHDE
jgi:hypothetical protein